MAGRVVHVEIAAADVDRAQGFWSGVFGWEISPSTIPGIDYRMFRTGENEGGALQPGEPGHLTVYLDTDDIDASLAKVGEHGGEAGAKMPVPGFGWLAACKDTEGNAFSLWQSDSSAG
ncbi:MAG TPA: VOC family protein [Gaiellaceae bacterium]|nr:VOC family protein [Gaiellaceae bacterium]